MSLHLYPELTWADEKTVCVSVSNTPGGRVIVRSCIVFDRDQHTMDASFRLCKNAENLVGQQYVCCAITKAYRMTMSGSTVSGVSLPLRGYLMQSAEVKGKPKNCRVQYASRHAVSLRRTHNNDMMQRRVLVHTLTYSALRLHTPRAQSAPSPSPSPHSSSLAGSKGGMRTSPWPKDSGVVLPECSLCMEQSQTATLFLVTCCREKIICEDCRCKLAIFCAPNPYPVCPWCRS